MSVEKFNQMKEKPSSMPDAPPSNTSGKNNKYGLRPEIVIRSLEIFLILFGLSVLAFIAYHLIIKSSEPNPPQLTLNCALGDGALYNIVWGFVVLDYIPWIVLELVTFYIEYYKLGWGKSKRFLIMLWYWAGFSTACLMSNLLTEQPMFPPSMTDKLEYADHNNGTIKCIPPLPSVSSFHYPQYQEMGWLSRLFHSRVSRRVFSIFFTTMFLSTYVSFRSRKWIRTFPLTLTIALVYSGFSSALVTIRGGLVVSQVFLGLIQGCGYIMLFIVLMLIVYGLLHERETLLMPADCVEVKTHKISMSQPSVLSSSVHPLVST